MSRIVDLISSKPRRKGNAAIARKFHFMTRFRERVGYRLTEATYQAILEKVIRDGKFLYRRDNELGAVYGVTYNNLRMKVVYDALTQTLITVLPFK